MNTQEAQFTLRAYRADGDAEDAPIFADALAHAQRDPALLEWLAHEQAFDAGVSSKLAQIAPPEDLRAGILAGARASRGEKRRIAFPLWLVAGAIAATVAVAFVLPRVMPNRESAPGPIFARIDASNLARFAAHNLAHGPHRHVNVPAALAIESALSAASTPIRETPGIDFASMRTAGCQVFAVGEQEVVEVCFKRNGEWYHLYVTRCERTRRAEPVITETGGAFVATWSDEANVYALASRAERRALEQVI